MDDTAPESAQEPLDITSEILLAHAARMQEIANESFTSSRALLTDNSTNIRKLSGIRSTVLEQALKKLGIESPLDASAPV